MKKTTFCAVVLVVLAGSTSWAADVWIPDQGLREAVQQELLITDGRDPTEAEMLTIWKLNCSGLGIRNLEGIQYAENFVYLWLFENDISDVSPLGNLTSLEILELGENPNIGTLGVGPLKDLTNLQTLGLEKTGISDISALQDMTQLTGAYLGGNSIEDLTPLTNITGMQLLALNRNSIEDVSPLAGMTGLKTLGMFENNIININALKGLTSLTSLDLSRNSIVSITALRNMMNLTGLTLSDNQFEDVEPLSELTNLTGLWLDGNPISDITDLKNLTDLTVLNLGHSTDRVLTDITALQDMTKLKWLDLSYNHIDDISPLGDLTELQSLDLFYNEYISDISALAGHLNLKYLNLRANDLNHEAYCVYIPVIEQNNQGIELSYNIPNPWPVCNTSPTAVITGPPSGAEAPVDVSPPIELAGEIVDPDEGDTHAYTWTISSDIWDDDLLVQGTSNDRTISELITFSEAGIYEIALTVTDDSGDSHTTSTVNGMPAFVVIYEPDSDGDGVLDKDDDCPDTLEGELVDEFGCSIAQLCPCDGEWKNHGSYVSCIAHVTDDWLEKGLLSEEEKDAVVSDAAQSYCGKKAKPDKGNKGGKKK